MIVFLQKKQKPNLFRKQKKNNYRKKEKTYQKSLNVFNLNFATALIP